MHDSQLPHAVGILTLMMIARTDRPNMSRASLNDAALTVLGSDGRNVSESHSESVDDWHCQSADV